MPQGVSELEGTGCCLCQDAERSWVQAVKDGDLKIVPERFEKVYNMWLGNIKDWCISRQLWWGHRIPVYYIFPNQVRLCHSSPLDWVRANQAVCRTPHQTEKDNFVDLGNAGFDQRDQINQ